MKTVRRIASLAIGFVFFVAGVLKLMDPVGTGLVVGEYFRFLHLPFLEFASKPAGLLFSFFEAALGAMLLTGLWKKTGAVLSAVLLGCFTILTLALWIFNPAMDCGCFGQALHLTHAQSFLKNVALDALWLLAFIPLGTLPEPQRIKYVGFSIAVLSLLVFTLYSVLSIPLVDYTPMKAGVELVKPSDPELDAAEEVSVFEKNGRFGSFDADGAPDSTWTFVRRETVVKNLPIYVEGEQALSFYNADGEYCDTLATSGNAAIVSVYDPRKMTASAWKRVSKAVDEASANGYTALVLLAALPDDVENVVPDSSLLPYVYSADRKMLLTLNRSNGGVTLASGGAIVGKWANRSCPDAETLVWAGRNDPAYTAMKTSAKGRIRLQGFLLYSIAVMLLL